jgi:hypothetical protein
MIVLFIKTLKNDIMKQRIGNTAQFYTLNLGSTTTSAANVEELHNRMTKNSPKVDLNLSIF